MSNQNPFLNVLNAMNLNEIPRTSAKSTGRRKFDHLDIRRKRKISSNVIGKPPIPIQDLTSDGESNSKGTHLEDLFQVLDDSTYVSNKTNVVPTSVITKLSREVEEFREDYNTTVESIEHIVYDVTSHEKRLKTIKTQMNQTEKRIQDYIDTKIYDGIELIKTLTNTIQEQREQIDQLRAIVDGLRIREEPEDIVPSGGEETMTQEPHTIIEDVYSSEDELKVPSVNDEKDEQTPLSQPSTPPPTEQQEYTIQTKLIESLLQRVSQLEEKLNQKDKIIQRKRSDFDDERERVIVKEFLSSSYAKNGQDLVISYRYLYDVFRTLLERLDRKMWDSDDIVKWIQKLFPKVEVIGSKRKRQLKIPLSVFDTQPLKKRRRQK